MSNPDVSSQESHLIWLVNGIHGLFREPNSTFNRVLYSENGALIDDLGNIQCAWTSVSPDGSSLVNNCSGWSSDSSYVQGHTGLITSTATTWRSATDKDCNSRCRLFCVESDPPRETSTSGGDGDNGFMSDVSTGKLNNEYSGNSISEQSNLTMIVALVVTSVILLVLTVLISFIVVPNWLT